jgi:hypothetical protein
MNRSVDIAVAIGGARKARVPKLSVLQGRHRPERDRDLKRCAAFPPGASGGVLVGHSALASCRARACP